MNRASFFCMGAVFLIALVGCGDSSPPRPKMTTGEFERLVLGKKGPEVIEAVGRPQKTQKGEGREFWYYDNVATDPITGKAASAQLVWPADSNFLQCETVNWH